MPLAFLAFRHMHCFSRSQPLGLKSHQKAHSDASSTVWKELPSRVRQSPSQPLGQIGPEGTQRRDQHRSAGNLLNVDKSPTIALPAPGAKIAPLGTNRREQHRSARSHLKSPTIALPAPGAKIAPGGAKRRRQHRSAGSHLNSPTIVLPAPGAKIYQEAQSLTQRREQLHSVGNHPESSTFALPAPGAKIAPGSKMGATHFDRKTLQESENLPPDPRGETRARRNA